MFAVVFIVINCFRSEENIIPIIDEPECSNPERKLRFVFEEDCRDEKPCSSGIKRSHSSSFFGSTSTNESIKRKRRYILLDHSYT